MSTGATPSSSRSLFSPPRKWRAYKAFTRLVSLAWIGALAFVAFISGWLYALPFALGLIGFVYVDSLERRHFAAVEQLAGPGVTPTASRRQWRAQGKALLLLVVVAIILVGH